MAEGAPLLREYRGKPLSRVRIPLSPPCDLCFHMVCKNDERLHVILLSTKSWCEFMKTLRQFCCISGRFTDESTG